MIFAPPTFPGTAHKEGYFTFFGQRFNDSSMASPPEEVSKPKLSSPKAASLWEPPVMCVQCGEDLKDPYLLACLHCLCRECLPRAAREDGRLKCPAPSCGDCSTTWRQPDVVALPRCEARSKECVPVQCATVGRYVEGRKIVRKVISGERISCGNTTCENPEGEATVFCSDCWLFFCISCLKGHKLMEGVIGKHNVKPIEAIRSGNRDSEASLLRKAVPLPCPQHKGEVFKYHCGVCDLLMCQACTVNRDSPHHPAFLSAEVPLPHQHLQAVERAQKVASSSKEQCRVARETAEGWVTEVERKKEAALRDIQQSFQAIHAEFDHRKEELCDQVRAVSEARKETVTDTIRTYRQKEDTLSNKQAMLSFLSTEGSPHEVISYSRVVDAGPAHRRSEATVSHVMQFLPEQEASLKSAIKGFWCVEVGACPANCTLEPTPGKVHRWSNNDPLLFTLKTAKEDRTPCSVGGDSVQAFLRPRPPIPGPSIKAEINDEENGQYKVTFNLTYTGECQLSVLVNGVHIRDSPFTVTLDKVTVRLPLVKNVSTLGACKGTLQFDGKPGRLTGVAVAPNGTIFVSDYEKRQIHVFSAARKHVKSFCLLGTAELSPRCVVSSSKGLLYVAMDFRVDVMTYDGDFVRHFGTGIIGCPWDLAEHNGEVFLVSTYYVHNYHCVAVFNEDGKLLRTFEFDGTGPGQLLYPSGVAVSPDGKLYVSDYESHCIHVLTTQGVYIREFGKGQLRYPCKLLISEMHVLIADNGNDRIAVFNHNGEFISSVATARSPVGLAVDQNGDILVACWDGQCVCIV